MSTLQIAVLSFTTIAFVPIFVWGYIELRKRSIYRAQMRHYIDLITAEYGNERADRLMREVIRLSKRHSILPDTVGYSHNDLRKATIKSLHRYAAGLRMFARREKREEITRRHNEQIRSIRSKIIQIKAKAA